MPGTSRPLTIAYLTSYYARASDTFVRDEVARLRAHGDTVITFSIRKPAESEVVDAAVASERARTTYLLELPRATFVLSALVLAATAPAAFSRALTAARHLGGVGLKGRAWRFFYLLEACVLARRLRRHRVDHLHNHIGEGSAAVAMLASILSSVPYSLTVHGPSEWDAPTELALDLKARHASFVATISEHTQGQMRRWIDPEDWDKVHVVRCGLSSPDDVVEAPPEPVVPTLVSVGRLAPVKGHLVLLEAVRGLAAGSVRVVIVGDGPERERLEGHLRRHDLLDTVELVGWKSPDEVTDLIASSTALVMPSFAEGLPVSIMEAYALGRPVVSSDVGGVSELVEPDRSGWLVPPGSVPALRGAILDVLATPPAVRLAMGAAGRASVRERHDAEVEVARLRGLIRTSAR